MAGEGEGLLRAILEHPDDDGVRVVYADWLEEHGEGERAEFIRVQCELARTPSCQQTPCEIPGCPAYALRRRERELLAGNAWAWAGRAIRDAMPAGAHYKDVLTFRRGFVAALTCTAADWLAHAGAILAAQPVEDVTLTTWPEVEYGWRNGTARLVGRGQFRSTRGLIADRDLVPVLLRAEAAPFHVIAGEPIWAGQIIVPGPDGRVRAFRPGGQSVGRPPRQGIDGHPSGTRMPPSIGGPYRQSRRNCGSAPASNRRRACQCRGLPGRRTARPRGTSRFAASPG